MIYHNLMQCHAGTLPLARKDFVDGGENRYPLSHVGWPTEVNRLNPLQDQLGPTKTQSRDHSNACHPLHDLQWSCIKYRIDHRLRVG